MPEAVVAEMVGLGARLENIREELRAMNGDEVARRFELGAHDKLWKSTISLCPTCLAHVPAIVYEIGGRVLMRKVCDAHGFSDAVVENDARYYNVSNKDRWGRRYTAGDGLKFPLFGEVEPGRSMCGEDGFEFAD